MSYIQFFLRTFSYVGIIFIVSQLVESAIILKPADNNQLALEDLAEESLLNAVQTNNINAIRDKLKHFKNKDPKVFLAQLTPELLQEIKSEEDQARQEVFNFYQEQKERFFEKNGFKSLIRAMQYDCLEIAQEAIARCQQYHGIASFFSLVTCYDKESENKTALFIAKDRHLPVIQEIFNRLEKYRDAHLFLRIVNQAIGKLKKTVIMHAIEKKQLAIAREIIVRCRTKELFLSIINTQDNDGNPVLEYILWKNCMGTLREILSHCYGQDMLADIINQGSRILKENSYNRSRKPFIKEVLYACCHNNIAEHDLINYIKIMLTKINTILSPTYKQIAQAVLHNNFDAVTELIDALEFMSSDFDSDNCSQDSENDELSDSSCTSLM